MKVLLFFVLPPSHFTNSSKSLGQERSHDQNNVVESSLFIRVGYGRDDSASQQHSRPK